MALLADARRPGKARRTAKALLKQIAQAGYEGGYTQLTDFIRSWRVQQGGVAIGKAFVPLTFELGEAFQFDWSDEALVIGGHYRKLHVTRPPPSPQPGSCKRCAMLPVRGRRNRPTRPHPQQMAGRPASPARCERPSRRNPASRSPRSHRARSGLAQEFPAARTGPVRRSPRRSWRDWYWACVRPSASRFASRPQVAQRLDRVAGRCDRAGTQAGFDQRQVRPHRRGRANPVAFQQ